MSRLLAGERILLTLWVGGQWAIGYLVAPSLFAHLDDRALAGTLAGPLFTVIAYIGLLCGAFLLLFNQWRNPLNRFNWRAVLLLLMVLLVAAGQFLLTPMIADLRAQGLSESAAFGRLHGLASLLYLLTSLAGLALVAAPADDASR